MIFGINFHWFFMIFHVFSNLDFGLDFWLLFWWKMIPKRLPKSTFFMLKSPKRCQNENTTQRGKASWSRPCSKIEFSMTFWMHFGPFCSPSAPFCSPLAPFWLPLAAFGLHFRWFWLHVRPFLAHFGAKLHILPSFLWILASISASAFFKTILGHKPTNPQTTNQPTTNQQRNKAGLAECALALWI